MIAVCSLPRRPPTVVISCFNLSPRGRFASGRGADDAYAIQNETGKGGPIETQYFDCVSDLPSGDASAADDEYHGIDMFLIDPCGETGHGRRVDDDAVELRPQNLHEVSELFRRKIVDVV